MIVKQLKQVLIKARIKEFTLKSLFGKKEKNGTFFKASQETPFPWKLKHFVTWGIFFLAYLGFLIFSRMMVRNVLLIKFPEVEKYASFFIYVYLLLSAYLFFFKFENIKFSKLFSNIKVNFLLFILVVEFLFIVFRAYQLRAWLVFLYSLRESLGTSVYEKVLNFRFFYRQIVMSMVLGPFVEELYFRGVFQNYLEKLTKPIIAVILASLVFTLLHLTDINLTSKSTIVVAVITRFAESIFWGYVYSKTKNLWYPIILHTFANMSIIVMLYFLSTKLIETLLYF